MALFDVELKIGDEVVRRYRVEAESATEAWLAASEYFFDKTLLHVCVKDPLKPLAEDKDIHEHFKVNYRGSLTKE